MTLGSVSRLSTPPISFRCGVFYQKEYKIIFIRNRKAASSTTMTVINVALGHQQAGPLVRLHPAQLRAEGVDVEAMWREYTVISSIRNPWARAGGRQVDGPLQARLGGGCGHRPRPRRGAAVHAPILHGLHDSCLLL